MTYGDIIQEIQTESRIVADNNFQPMCISLLNELFKEATLAERPFELRKGVGLLANPSTGITALPSDFFVHHEVVYQDVNTGKKWPLYDLDDAAQPAPIGFYGRPTGFEIITGNQIIINNVSGIISGDIINLIYYKQPLLVTSQNLTTQNPLLRLEPFLIRAAIRRVRMFHSDDVQVATLLEGDITSASNIFAKDEPEPMPPAQPATP